MKLIERIRKAASVEKRTICLPESLIDDRTIKAASQLLEDGTVTPLIIGNKDRLNKFAESAGVSIEGIKSLDIDTFDRLDEMISIYQERRSKENLTKEQVRELLNDPLYFGAMLVNMKIANGMVAVAVNSTGNVIRAAIKCVGSKPGIRTVSSSFLMIMPPSSPVGEKVFTFSDCAFIPQPTVEQLADIAEAAAENHQKLTGEDPVVAMLSFSTKGSAKTDDTQKVVDALNIVKERSPELKIDGEFQLDSAIIESVAAKKAPDSEYGGKANVLVFPDLDAANIGYKLTQRLAGAEAYGPLAQGTVSPVNDLSRGCDVDDIVQVSIITAAQV